MAPRLVEHLSTQTGFIILVQQGQAGQDKHMAVAVQVLPTV
jgi:hypothetical protein